MSIFKASQSLGFVTVVHGKIDASMLEELKVTN